MSAMSAMTAITSLPQVTEMTGADGLIGPLDLVRVSGLSGFSGSSDFGVFSGFSGAWGRAGPGGALAVALLVSLAALLWPLAGRRRSERHPDMAVANEGGDEGGDGGAREPASAAARPDVATVADTLVLLALAFRSGVGTSAALESVASASDHPGVRADLRAASAALRWGADDRLAWTAAGPEWTPAAQALALSRAAGLAPTGLLLNAADDAIAAAAEAGEVAAARVGVRLVAPIALLVLPGFVLSTVVPVVLALAGELMASAP